MKWPPVPPPEQDKHASILMVLCYNLDEREQGNVIGPDVHVYIYIYMRVCVPNH